MTQATQLSSVLSQTTNIWGFQPTNVTASSVSGYLMTHLTIELEPTRPSQVECGMSIQDLAAERDADPRKSAAMDRARRRHALSLEDSPAFSLAALRLSKGLSQTKLAHLMGVQQPYVARIEKGEDDLKTSTIEKFAVALGVSEIEVFKAIHATRSNRERVA
jgi:DNA-binding transcriptional regulator YiaG